MKRFKVKEDVWIEGQILLKAGSIVEAQDYYILTMILCLTNEEGKQTFEEISEVEHL
jgi:hypothetical protein